MYLVYLFKEKKTGEIIYVGSSARPAERMKEHVQAIDGRKKCNMPLYKYINSKGLKLYKDIEVIWVDAAKDKESMYELEAQYYYKYRDTVKNDRPAEIRNGEFNPKRRKVKCLNDGRVFPTVMGCSQFYGKSRTQINRVLSHECEYTYINGEPYYFEYVS